MPTADESLILGCSLAGDYHAKSMSPHALLTASGYREHCDSITVEKIREHVARHPELVGEWVAYSENKRTSSGWYLAADSAHGPFELGWFPTCDPAKSEKTFTDGVEACALYIKHELESIAS
jgi:hypothetical protein